MYVERICSLVLNIGSTRERRFFGFSSNILTAYNLSPSRNHAKWCIINVNGGYVAMHKFSQDTISNFQCATLYAQS